MEGPISVGHIYTDPKTNVRVRVEVSDTATHILTRDMRTGRVRVRPVVEFRDEITKGVLRLSEI